jgi:hypothetical protein
MYKKTVMAILIIAGFSLPIVTGMHILELSKGNPITIAHPQFTLSPEWVYMENITGNHSQTVDVFMPNLSHWRVGGTVISFPGTSAMNISYGSQYTWESPSGYTSNHSWWIGLEHTNTTEQGQGNVQIKIAASNIESYFLTVEYYNDSTAEHTNTPTQTPSISPSPTQQPTTPTAIQTLTPSPSPSTSFSPSPSQSQEPKPTPTPSPSVPEFPTWIILILIVASNLLMTYKRKETKR